MASARPDFSLIVQDNEGAALGAIAEGRYLDAFLLLHTLIESILRILLEFEADKFRFAQLIDRYVAFLDEQKYPHPTFVEELRQFNLRRNRIVHQLWRRSYSDANRQTEQAVGAAHRLYGLFIEWLETFDPEITRVGFQYDG